MYKTKTMYLLKKSTCKFLLNTQKFFVLALLAVGVSSTVQAQTWKTTAASTDWFTAANWSTNAVPTAATDVIIPVGATNYPVVSSGAANSKSITLSTGAGAQPSLTVSGGTLTNTTGFTINAGSVTLSGGTVTLKDFTVASGLTVTQSGGNLLKISHDWKNSGTFNSTAGTVEYDGNATAASDYSLGTNQFNNVIVDATFKPMFDNSTCTISINGNFTNNNTTLNLTAAAGFSFNGAGNQSISSAATGTNTTFGTLVINNTGGTVSLSNNVVVSGDATITNGIFDLTTFTCNRKTAGGTFTVSAGATFKLEGTFPTNFTTGTFASTSTVEYYGTAAQTVAAYNYGNLTTSGARATNSITYASGTVGVSNTFSPNTTFTTGGRITTGNTINFDGSISQTIPAFPYNSLTSSSTGARTLDASANIKIAGTFTAGTNTYTITGSTVEFNGATASTIPVLTVSSGPNYNNLTFSGTAANFTFGAAMTIGGDLTISNGTVDMNNSASARTITLTGNYNQSGGTLDLGSGTGLTTVNISGNITQTAGSTTTVGSPSSNNIFSFTGQHLQTISLAVPANYIYVDYLVGNGDSLQLASNLNLTTYTSITYVGTMTVNSSGTIIFPAAYTITHLGTAVTSPVFSLNSGAKMLTANASGVDGSVPSTNMTRTYNAGANYEFNGTTGQNAGLVNTSVNNIAASVSGILNLNTDAAVGGTLTVNSGCTFTPGAANVVSGAGTLTGSGTAQVTRTTATADFNTQYSVTTKTLTNLTIDYNATGAQTINALNYSNLTTSGARTSNSVTFASSGTIGISGVFSPISTYTTGGRIMTGSTIDFNGTSAQSIPAITYNNLTASGSGSTKTAAGAVVINGTLTINSNVIADMAAYDLSGTLSATSGTGTLKTQSTSAAPLPAGKTWSGTVEYYYATGTQYVMGGTYAGLTISNTSGADTATAAISVSTTFTLNTSAILDMSTYVLSGAMTTITGLGRLRTQNTSSLPIPTGKTWTGIVVYNSATGGQTVVAGTYNSLTNNSPTGVNTAAAAFTVNGTLTLTGAGSMLDMATYALSGTLTTITGVGAIRTQNTSSTPIPTGKTWTGTIEYNNATGGQTIVAGTYTNLSNSNTSGTNTAGAVPTVNGVLTLNSSSVLDMSSYALIGAVTSISGTGTLKTQSSSSLPIPSGKTWPGTIVYNNATGGQTIVAGTYTNLTNSNTSGTNTCAAALSVSGTLTLNSSSVLDLVTYALSGSISSITGTGTLKTQNTSSTPIPTGKTWACGIEYNNATGGQTVVAGTYTNLTNSNTSGTNTCAAVLSVSGTLTLNSSSVLDLASYALSGSISSITGAGTLKTQNTSSTPIPTGKTWAGTIHYNNATGGQTIVAGTYTNLTNNNTSGTNTAAAALSVSGTLTLSGTSVLDLGTYALSGTVSTITGTGTLKTQNTSSTPIPSGQTWTGPVYYNSSSAQTIIQGNYSDLNGTGGDRTFDTTSAIGVSGTFTPGSGTYTITGSTINFNSGGAQNLPAFNFYNVTVSGGNTKSVAGSVAVKNLLKLGNNTTLALGNNYITLKSDSSNTASIAAVPTTAAITYGTGAFTVERYVIGRRKYRMITSSVTTSPNTTLIAGEESKSIWGNWQNQGINTTHNLGTFITGGNATDGFDTQLATASMYTYDAVNRVFKPFSTANGKNTKYTPLKAGRPYYLFVYGDRMNTVTTSNPNNTVLTATGTVLYGDQVYDSTGMVPISTTVNQYSLLGNPYAATVDWKTVTKAGVSKTIWGWDPNLNSTGGYVTVTDILNGILISPLSSAVKISQQIQPGQAFFVKTISTNPSVTIHESDKINNTTNGIFRVTTTPNPLIAINMLYTANSITSLADGVVTAFDPSYSNDVNDDDVVKYPGSTEVVSILKSGNLLNLETRQFPGNNDTMFLNMQRLTKPVYTLEIFAQDVVPGAFEATLVDKYLNTQQILSLTDTNHIDVLRTADPLSYSADRFMIVFNNFGALPVTFTSVKAMRQNDKILVDWSVENQVNISKYTVERSADGVHFTGLGIQAANTAITGNYSYSDGNPLSGDNFYRIKSTGIDGQVSYSVIVGVKTAASAGKLSVSPNPIIGEDINVLMENIAVGSYNVRIINMGGALIAAKDIQHSGGTQVYTIHIPGMAAGIYTLELTQPGSTRLFYKIVKL